MDLGTDIVPLSSNQEWLDYAAALTWKELLERQRRKPLGLELLPNWSELYADVDARVHSYQRVYGPKTSRRLFAPTPRRWGF